jgi:hypothetical protein
VSVQYEIIFGWVGGWFIITGWFTNPDLTSDEGLPRRVHFCVSAHKNSNHKSVCLDREFNLGKLTLERLGGEMLVWLSSVWCVGVCVCMGGWVGGWMGVCVVCV